MKKQYKFAILGALLIAAIANSVFAIMTIGKPLQWVPLIFFLVIYIIIKILKKKKLLFSL